MNIKNIFKSAAILGVGSLMMTGCASDYLDTPYHGIVDAENIASTVDNARATLQGAASSMAVMWSNNSTGPAQALIQGETGLSYYMGEIPGSDCYVNFIYDQAPAWILLYNTQPGALNNGNYVWNEPMWLYCYSLINQMNELIAGIDNAEGDAQEREFIKGQAYTIRAHCYWRLLQLYAPRWEDSNNGEKLSSVVLRTVPGQPKEMEVSPMNDVLNLIYSDLNTAIEAYGKAGNQKRLVNYAPDLNVCYGVYARVAALKHDWATCRDMAEKAQQGKRLSTVAESMSGYNSFVDGSWLWCPSFDEVDNAIYGNWCTFFGCNSYGAVNDNYTNSIDITLYRQIPEGDKRREWWLTVDKLAGVNQAMAYNSKTVNQVTQKFTAAALIRAARTWLDDHQNTYKLPGDKAYSGENKTTTLRDGAQVKFWVDGLTGQNKRAQVPFMRTAEMLLYQAEACAELGDAPTAQKLLEKLNTVYNPNYKCTATGQDLINEIRLYRRIELWGEGFCWFDLKRWNIPLQRKAWEAGNVNSGNWPEPLAVTVPVTQNNGWRYGIPLYERTYNVAITTPIPGESLTTNK
ncbi:MAG: RagB/SusD family nutrient uptake outer membrane protein [Muribaculaceae bacterium]|nr:RagB/SusD family nutrient uptake outer membrane protein [Muribaculaceae bacterium]